MSRVARGNCTPEGATRRKDCAEEPGQKGDNQTHAPDILLPPRMLTISHAYEVFADHGHLSTVSGFTRSTVWCQARVIAASATITARSCLRSRGRST
jgi:hypothetical protein